jgi:hypothetical protein
MVSVVDGACADLGLGIVRLKVCCQWRPAVARFSGVGDPSPNGRSLASREPLAERKMLTERASLEHGCVR